MSDITFTEKMNFEKLFGMASGYVLDFSNRTFKAFVANSVQRNIFDSKYDNASGSKANRLRAFWDREPNDIVGKLLSDLLEYKEALGPNNDDAERYLREHCHRASERLRAAAPRHVSSPLAEPLSQGVSSDHVAFGIVTALEKEYAAMKVMLDSPVECVTPRGRIYWRGQIPAKGGGTHGIALALADQGTAVATHRATLLAEDFTEIEAVLMVGIAGGVPHVAKPDRHVRLGDIVASGEHGVIAYDFVKEHATRLEPRHPPRPPHSGLYQACRRLGSIALEDRFPWLTHLTRARGLPNSVRPGADTDWLADTANPTQRAEHPPDPDRDRHPGASRVFIGTIACANRLLKNPVHRDQIRDEFDVRAVEMEGFGIAEATWNQSIGYLIIRGICDYCDPHKGDSWQGYAAIVAAAYARAVLEEMPLSLRAGAQPLERQARTNTPGSTHTMRGAGDGHDGGLRVVDVSVIDKQAELRRFRKLWLGSKLGAEEGKHAAEFPLIDIKVRNVSDLPVVLKGLHYEVLSMSPKENDFSPSALPVSWEYNLPLDRGSRGTLKMSQVVRPKDADRFVVIVGHDIFNLAYLNCELDLQILYNEDQYVDLGRHAVRVFSPIWNYPRKDPADIQFLPLPVDEEGTPTPLKRPSQQANTEDARRKTSSKRQK